VLWANVIWWRVLLRILDHENLCEQNFKGEANNKGLEIEDTQ